MCGGDSRSAVTAITYPNGAVGSLGGCTGTIIAPNKVMTASHCVESTASPSSIVFSPQFGILTSGSGPAGSSPNRITQGRDGGDHEQYADWAILTFSNNFSTQLGTNYQQMYRVIPTGVPFTATLIGYHGDLYSNRPGRETCSVDAYAAWDNETLLHMCDVQGGASGGPIFAMSGGLAQLLAVQSGHGSASDCVGQNGNNAANGKWFSFAPDNAGGVAMAYKGDGRLAAYATDKDWSLVGQREKLSTDPSSNWTAWGANDSAFSGGRKMSAVNLADNRQELFVVNSSGQLRSRWQTSVDGGWSGWVTMSTPTTVKDVAATGGSGVATHVFILGTDNVVRVAYKTGDSSSAWSAWYSFGTVSGASSLSAVYFGTHQVFIASTSGGAYTAWGSSGSFTGLNAFGTSSGGFKTIGAGRLVDGRVNVMAVNGSGTLMMRIRAADGSSWTGWTTMPQANPMRVTSMNTLAMGRLSDGRQQVLGIGSDGNIYALWEFSAGSFLSNWVRFYK